MSGITAKHVKVTSFGSSVNFKKDGYAAGRVPDAVVGVKNGKVKGSGYSGPNVAKGPKGSW